MVTKDGELEINVGDAGALVRVRVETGPRGQFLLRVGDHQQRVTFGNAEELQQFAAALDDFARCIGR